MIGLDYVQSGPEKNDPLDYAVYTVSASVHLYKQCSILIVVLHKVKPNPMCWNFTQKYYDLIEGPLKHFDTVAKYISDDVFVSMTASRSSQSWEISLSGLSFLWDFR